MASSAGIWAATPTRRRAACEAVKLRRADKPVPDDIREMSNRYKRWVYRGGQDPGEGDGRKPVHDYVPAELRAAHAAVCRKRYNGQAPTKEEAAMSNEYFRWIMHGRPAARRACLICGTSVFRLGKLQQGPARGSGCRRLGGGPAPRQVPAPRPASPRGLEFLRAVTASA